MSIPFFHIDAFTDRLFSGNPAGICLIEKALPDLLLTQIAQEHNLPATVFLLPTSKTEYAIRWFAPEYEIDLCGHGTLAAAFVVFNYLHPTLMLTHFHHHKVGTLQVSRHDKFIRLNFPVKNLKPYPTDVSLLQTALGKKPLEIFQYKEERLLVVFDTEQTLHGLNPNIELLKQLSHRGVIVTAPANNTDFVSRVFYPHKQIYEDAVTGSSFCLLAPYWQKRLNKNTLTGFQLSKRGGAVTCQVEQDTVALYGQAVLFNQGVISLNG